MVESAADCADFAQLNEGYPEDYSYTVLFPISVRYVHIIHDDKYNLTSSYLEGEFVTIEVGSAIPPMLFTLHKQLLRNCSTVFERELQAAEEEGHGNNFSLKGGGIHEYLLLSCTGSISKVPSAPHLPELRYRQDLAGLHGPLHRRRAPLHLEAAGTMLP